MAFAQQVMQFGGATASDALQVATSGNLGPAVDPNKEAMYRRGRTIQRKVRRYSSLIPSFL
jgi:hypothetical protein